MVAAVVLAALLGGALLAQPSVRVRLDAAALTVDVLDLPVPPTLRGVVERQRTSIGGIAADVYGAHRTGRAIVLVPGAAPAGRDDQRIVSLAEAAARRGRVVVVPELDVYDERLTAADVDRIRTLASLLAADHGPVVLAGISFGGSLSLLAVADADTAADVALVATLGAFGDLLAVSEAALVGHVMFRGSAHVWDADPRAPQIVREELLGMLDSADADAVRAVLDGEVPVELLEEDLAAVVALIGAEDTATFQDATKRLPDALLEVIATFSPSRHAVRIEVPVVAMHARNDPVIPYVELLRLEEALDDIEVIHLDGFGHVGVDTSSSGEVADALGDVRGVWRFATRLLATGFVGPGTGAV